MAKRPYAIYNTGTSHIGKVYIGRPRSIDLLFTKASLSAPEAKDLGLLTGVSPDEAYDILGHELQLPDQYEPMRTEIEGRLPIL